MKNESAFENEDDRQVDYEGITIIAGSMLVERIMHVVMRLPNDVAQWVAANITFIDFTGRSGLACHVATSFSSQHRLKPDFGGIRLLVIVAYEEDEADEKTEFRIAHVIAHHWVGHFEGSASTPEVYERQEQEADSQANLWGFVGSSTRIEGAIGESASVFADLATAYFGLGVVTLKDFLNRVAKRMGPDAKKYTAELTDAWNQVQTANEDRLNAITDKIDITDSETIGRAARELYRYVIERDALDTSAADREAAVDAVHAILVNFVPAELMVAWNHVHWELAEEEIFNLLKEGNPDQA